MCHVSRVSCHISFFSSFFLQSGEASWWRVCYQRGLPRLVFLLQQILNILHFSLDIYFLNIFNQGDESKVTCNHCGKTISRGKTGTLPKMMSNISMCSHLASKHADTETARAKREQDKKEVKSALEEETKARDETDIVSPYLVLIFGSL